MLLLSGSHFRSGEISGELSQRKISVTDRLCFSSPSRDWSLPLIKAGIAIIL